MNFQDGKHIIFVVSILSVSISFTSSSVGQSNDWTHRNLTQGRLKGTLLRSPNGKDFYGFMGIPFAQKPERFQPAKTPSLKWEGVYDATNYRSKCVQFNATTKQTEGDEDCLFINVFTPNPTANLSVLAFIHGGGFQFGLAYENGPEYFLEHDVVFVTFSYRLAALGFLSTGDKVIPGNLGLKDQTLALTWIQNNINVFGGDKNRVTLFGESAGAASVSLHVLSPISRGLFRHAICQSGTSLDRWTIAENPKKTADMLSNKLNCPNATSTQILECLKTKSAKEIVDVQLGKSIIENLLIYSPVVEQIGTHSNPAFITDLPMTLYEQEKFSKIPLLMTVNNVEGLLLHTLGVLASQEITDAFNNDWDNTARSAFYLTSNYNTSQHWATQRLREFYFGDENVGTHTLLNLTNIYSDAMFIHRTRRTALSHGKHAPVYLAVLGFKGIWSQTFLYGFRDILGMTHADDLSYLFTDHKYPEFPVGSKSEQFSKLLVKLWVNFAEYGDPNLEVKGQRWSPITRRERTSQVVNWLYLKNDHEFLSEPLRDRMDLWDKIDIALQTGIIPQNHGKDEL